MKMAREKIFFTNRGSKIAKEKSLKGFLLFVFLTTSMYYSVKKRSSLW